MLRPLILDLDFTLLHLEFRENSIEVPGRTRSAWIAPQTVEILAQLQTKFQIILATARSWDGTRPVCEGLESRGVRVRGLVIEDGALVGAAGALNRFDPRFDLNFWRDFLGENPVFQWQNDFEACLVARCEHQESAAHLVEHWRAKCAANSCENWRLMRDGRKVYLLPRAADKWSALGEMLGENAKLAAGAGDGENDLCWLPNIAFPATFARAKPVLVRSVRAKNGFISEKDGHDGIAEILRRWI